MPLAITSPAFEPGRPTRIELAGAMRGHVLAEAELVGVYEKQRR